jgi:hypothetical protein
LVTGQDATSSASAHGSWQEVCALRVIAVGNSSDHKRSASQVSANEHAPQVPPFPALRPVTYAAQAAFAELDPGVWGTTAVRTCSVCDGPVEKELHQVWISRRVGTDVLPLLVNACSAKCLAELPEPRRLPHRKQTCLCLAQGS